VSTDALADPNPDPNAAIEAVPAAPTTKTRTLRAPQATESISSTIDDDEAHDVIEEYYKEFDEKDVNKRKTTSSKSETSSDLKDRLRRNAREQQRASLISSQYNKLRDAVTLACPESAVPQADVPDNPASGKASQKRKRCQSVTEGVMSKHDVLMTAAKFINSVAQRRSLLKRQLQLLDLNCHAANTVALSSTTTKVSATPTDYDAATVVTASSSDTGIGTSSSNGRFNGSTSHVYSEVFQNCVCAMAITTGGGEIIQANKLFRNLAHIDSEQLQQQQQLYDPGHKAPTIFTVFAFSHTNNDAMRDAAIGVMKVGSQEEESSCPKEPLSCKLKSGMLCGVSLSSVRDSDGIVTHLLLQLHPSPAQEQPALIATAQQKAKGEENNEGKSNNGKDNNDSDNDNDNNNNNSNDNGMVHV
jgi:hypothetical protein